jgi:hypothetical protein
MAFQGVVAKLNADTSALVRVDDFSYKYRTRDAFVVTLDADFDAFLAVSGAAALCLIRIRWQRLDAVAIWNAQLPLREYKGVFSVLIAKSPRTGLSRYITQWKITIAMFRAYVSERAGRKSASQLPVNPHQVDGEKCSKAFGRMPGFHTARCKTFTRVTRCRFALNPSLNPFVQPFRF